jgi:hypothetical protein
VSQPRDFRLAYISTQFLFLPTLLGGDPVEVARGAFEHQPVFTSGVFSVSAPFPWGVESVTVGDSVVTDLPLDPDAASRSRIRVVVSDRMGRVVGRARRNNRPVLDGVVVVFAADSKFWGYPTRHVVVCPVAPDGTFVSDGVPGGLYHMAWVPVLGRHDEHDPVYLDSLKSLGRTVTIRPGQELTEDIEIQ